MRMIHLLVPLEDHSAEDDGGSPEMTDGIPTLPYDRLLKSRKVRLLFTDEVLP